MLGYSFFEKKMTAIFFNVSVYKFGGQSYLVTGPYFGEDTLFLLLFSSTFISLKQDTYGI